MRVQYSREVYTYQGTGGVYQEVPLPPGYTSLPSMPRVYSSQHATGVLFPACYPGSLPTMIPGLSTHHDTRVYTTVVHISHPGIHHRCAHIPPGVYPEVHLPTRVYPEVHLPTRVYLPEAGWEAYTRCVPPSGWLGSIYQVLYYSLRLVGSHIPGYVLLPQAGREAYTRL